MVITAILPEEVYDVIITKERYAPDDAKIRCFKGDIVDEDTWEEPGEFVKIVFDPDEADIMQDPVYEDIVTVSRILKEDVLTVDFFVVHGLEINCEDTSAEPD